MFHRRRLSSDASPQRDGLSLPYRTLVNLLAQESLPAGDALLGQLWTPHLDTHQRVLILDALSSAAHQMSHSPRALPGGPFQGALGTPAAAHHTAPGGARISQGNNAKSRVWGHRSLALADKAPPRTHRNRSAVNSWWHCHTSGLLAPPHVV